MTAYYNENDAYAAQWLRNLIKAGLIAPGVVDERDIRDVTPNDLASFTQCHFFAGIGVWSLALRKGLWPDDMPVWTGSCPCQPFSASGRREGFTDERHLWPHWFHLISQCRPPTVFGEQVASPDGLAWFDLVQADMEGADYAVGPVDTCAAGVGAPHLRQRLYFVADTARCGSGAGLRHREPTRQRGVEFADGGGACSLANTGCGSLQHQRHGLGGTAGAPQGETRQQRFWIDGRDGSAIGGLADTDLAGQRPSGGQSRPPQAGDDLGRSNPSSELGYSKRARPQGHPRNDGATRGWPGEAGPIAKASLSGDPGPTNGLWRDVDWLLCRDGKWRAVEPATFPLVNGTPARVGRLRAYGNAIVLEEAAQKVEAYRFVRGLDLI